MSLDARETQTTVNSDAVIHDPAFRRWIEQALAAGEHRLAQGNQGALLLYAVGEHRLVVKCPEGSVWRRAFHRWGLRRERAAYARLAGLEGVPRCLGMVADRYLVLEYRAGTPYRHASLDDRTAWFEALRALIDAIHARGVCHADLKRKSNILVTPDQRPCVLDFGAASIRKSRWHVLNNLMFRFGCRLDRNAWVKHKYHGRYEHAHAGDRAALRYSLIERLLRWRRLRKRRREET